MNDDKERGNVLAKACPSRQILEHLTSRWGVFVLIVLRDGTLRFSEIRRRIEGISERMLTLTLQNLQADGMVVRTDYHTVPPKVDYQLSEYGAVAAAKIYDLVDWLEINLDEILDKTKQS
ncbi:HxlR family transcriptional regulator [Moraxella caviae]|uniref:HxlR family transcriptional regulator n=1 Tax=Moraxella caviae TaxID=34060 RepID=A0A1T0ACM9_9GAMM|nr:helix-turn-helix domain-containing protein [Moraxella caviae]OOR93428.1 HxlR family transcriptional regulator [Moraxella caviae]STZ14086.1 Uncharacterized HTH-type transcriptional regulator yybR [Moraxella caviae]VEW11157.1 Uncharacterized HTH-type transcriptional regulator yybR [Moraxella caviae]